MVSAYNINAQLLVFTAICSTIGALSVSNPECFGFYGEWIGKVRDKAILNAQKLKKRYFKWT